MKRVDLFLLIIVLVVASFFVFNNFLTMPRIGWDEGMNMLLARNISEFGKWQIPISPGEFSSEIYYYSTGWVVLVPVAFVFKIFGPSFFAARIVMAFYLFGFLILAFFLAKRWFGRKAAFLSVLFLAVFSPIYNFGKPMLGEVPSLFWLSLGIFFLEYLKDKKPTTQAILSGLCFGMYAAAKPTYLILFSVLVGFFILFFFLKKRLSLRVLFSFLISYLIMIIPTLWTRLVRGLLFSSSDKVLDFYANSRASSCISCDIVNNIFSLFSSRSLMYMDILIVFSLAMTFIYWRKFGSLPWIVWGAWLYGFLNLVYFLKGAGTPRYLFQVQAVLVFVAPFAVFKISEFLSEKKPEWENLLKIGGWIIVVGLFLVQFMQLTMIGYATPSDAPARLESFIKEQLPVGGKIGVINLPAASVLVSADRLVHYINIIHRDVTEGQNPLTFSDEKLPKFLIYDESDEKNITRDIEPFRNKLEKNYKKIARFEDGGLKYVVMQKI